MQRQFLSCKNKSPCLCILVGIKENDLSVGSSEQNGGCCSDFTAGKKLNSASKPTEIRINSGFFALFFASCTGRLVWKNLEIRLQW